MDDTPRYVVNVSSLASDDIVEILDWTIETFGEDAYSRYDLLINQAFEDLGANPMSPSIRQPEGFPKGIFAYHLRDSRDRARSSLGIVRSPRHFVIFRLRDSVVEVLRILHDAQDLRRHVPDN